MLVPPVNVRPSITLESGERSEDDLTHKLVDIMRINLRLEQNLNAGAPQIIIDDLWELLQYHVTTYFNNETSSIPPARHRSGRALKTLAQRLKGKEGRFRYNLSGKRVNYSARTVISVDPNINIDEVGVPFEIASKLTVPFYVTAWNMERAKELLLRTEYPMVMNVISKDGKRKRVIDANREELLKELAGWRYSRKAAYGWRHSTIQQAAFASQSIDNGSQGKGASRKDLQDELLCNCPVQCRLRRRRNEPPRAADTRGAGRGKVPDERRSTRSSRLGMERQ